MSAFLQKIVDQVGLATKIKAPIRTEGCGENRKDTLEDIAHSYAPMLFIVAGLWPVEFKLTRWHLLYFTFQSLNEDSGR